MTNEKKLFYSIGEVSDILKLKPYVLRYWETEFQKLNPQKSLTGQRTYRAKDIQLALTIKKLLYDDKYTIAGASQKLEELDNHNGLVAFPEEPLTPASSQSSTVSFETPSHASLEPTTPSRSEENSNSQVDLQKVRYLKTLIEATKKLLQKYNLS